MDRKWRPPEVTREQVEQAVAVSNGAGLLQVAQKYNTGRQTLTSRLNKLVQLGAATKPGRGFNNYSLDGKKLLRRLEAGEARDVDGAADYLRELIGSPGNMELQFPMPAGADVQGHTDAIHNVRQGTPDARQKGGRADMQGEALFTPDQVTALRRMADREIAMSTTKRTGGAKQAFASRLDPGLLEGLKGYADANRISLTAALEQAVDAFLNMERTNV